MRQAQRHRLQGLQQIARRVYSPLYHAAHGHPEKFRLITFEGAFHGRTLATIAARTGTREIHVTDRDDLLVAMVDVITRDRRTLIDDDHAELWPLTLLYVRTFTV